MLAPVSFPLPLNNSKHNGYVSGSDLHINLSPGMGEVDARSKESKLQEPAPHCQTPFVIQCRRCSLGTMMHDKTFRKETVPPYIVVVGWYRPTLEQTLKMSEAAIHHVLQGGLFLEDEINVNSNDND